MATVKPPRLGEYTAEWSDGQIQLLEFRSEPYFTAEDLRAYDPQLSDGITDADIAKVREHVEDVFDRASGTAFAPRGAYERHVGNGTNSIRPDHLAPCRVTKCLVDGAEFEGAAAYGWNVSFPAIISRGSVVELWLEYGYRIRRPRCCTTRCSTPTPSSASPRQTRARLASPASSATCNSASPARTARREYPRSTHSSRATRRRGATA